MSESKKTNSDAQLIHIIMLTCTELFCMHVSMSTNQAPENADKRRAWIKYQLDIAGSSFADIARELGVTRGAVRKATWMSYPKMERAIAAKIGRRPEEIWPERYAT